MHVYPQFFSFGTNDLTQMTYGISRDDAQARFLQVQTTPCEKYVVWIWNIACACLPAY
jgi:phosphoenolpyruvate synthase/pyruvate phosphate dikinase